MGRGRGSVSLSLAASKGLSWLCPMPLSWTALPLPPRCHLCPFPGPAPTRAELPSAFSWAPQQGDCQLLCVAKGHQGQNHSKAVITKTIDMVSDSTLQLTFEKLPILCFSLYQRRIAIVVWKSYWSAPLFFHLPICMRLNFLHIFNQNNTSQQTECRSRHGNPAIICGARHEKIYENIF